MFEDSDPVKVSIVQSKKNMKSPAFKIQLKVMSKKYNKVSKLENMLLSIIYII